MATISISFVAGQTTTVTKTVSGAHLTRMLAAFRAHFGIPAATDEQVAQAVAENIFAGLKACVRNIETNAAVAAANQSAGEITLT